MKITKVLLTTDHVENHKDRTYGAFSVSSDLETFPFIDSGYALILFPAGKLNVDQINTIIHDVDIVVFTGGLDVDPLLYGEEMAYSNVHRYALRDQVEMLLLEVAITQKKRIFGICRGQQLINTYFKGTLYQNVVEQKQAKVRHMQDPVDKLTHKISIEKDSFLDKVYKKSEIIVNSYHNQAVKELGEGLKAVAHSSDGIIEAVQHESLPIRAVQWHPEVSYHFDINSKKLINSLYKIF